ncbi:MAG TPA: hypothetical protein ENN60_02530 [archaeon]|nr:hypothetical protein [archaeon]
MEKVSVQGAVTYFTENYLRLRFGDVLFDATLPVFGGGGRPEGDTDWKQILLETHDYWLEEAKKGKLNQGHLEVGEYKHLRFALASLLHAPFRGVAFDYWTYMKPVIDRMYVLHTKWENLNDLEKNNITNAGKDMQLEKQLLEYIHTLGSAFDYELKILAKA